MQAQIEQQAARALELAEKHDKVLYGTNGSEGMTTIVSKLVDAEERRIESERESRKEARADRRQIQAGIITLAVLLIGNIILQLIFK